MIDRTEVKLHEVVNAAVCELMFLGFFELFTRYCGTTQDEKRDRYLRDGARKRGIGSAREVQREVKWKKIKHSGYFEAGISVACAYRDANPIADLSVFPVQKWYIRIPPVHAQPP